MSLKPADLLLVGADVLTLAPGRPHATQVAIAEGKVLAVADAGLPAKHRGTRTQIVDLHRATVTPGLVDSHLHPVLGQRSTDGVDLCGCTNLDQVRQVLAVARERSGWLVGWGLDPNAFGDAPLSAASLGTILDGRLAYITLFDGHSAIASDRALEWAGVTGPRTFSSRSTVVCDEADRPTGLLLEFDALDLVTTILPRPSPTEQQAALAATLAEMAATGLTGAHAMDLDDEALELYRQLEDTNRLPMRLRLAPWCRPGDGRDRWEEIVLLQQRRGRLWEVSMVKFFLDGTIDGGTAWLHEPDCRGESTDAYWQDPDDYSEAVGFFAAAGVQTATHAIGDAAVQHTLDTLQRAAAAGSPVRHRIEHIETLPTDQVPRFGQIGVVASMQPTHATDYTRADHSDNWSRRLGDDRADHGWRCRDILEAGGVVTLGSDWPVAPYDPRIVLASAQTRAPTRHPDLPPVGPSQRLTAQQALAGYTLAPAYTAGLEGRSGTITPGAAADLTIFADNPLRVNPRDLPDLPVTMTVLDGVVRAN